MQTPLLTPAETAAKLGISKKTLRAHVAAGAIRYVLIGTTARRPRRAFTEADVDEFIARQTRRDVPVPLPTPPTRRKRSTRGGGVVAIADRFTAKAAELRKRYRLDDNNPD